MFVYRHGSIVSDSADPYHVYFVQNLREWQKIILAQKKHEDKYETGAEVGETLQQWSKDCTNVQCATFTTHLLNNPNRLRCTGTGSWG